MATIALGKNTQYPDQYDPGLLFPILRSENRQKLGITPSQAVPFVGVDIWNAFELSWLNTKGKPQIALAEFQIPADSPNMIESKSFKLYLNSLNNARFENEDEVRERVGKLQTVSEKTMICSDRPDLDALRSTNPGTIAELHQFRPHPDHPREFWHNGAPCRYFLDSAYVRQDVRTFQGVICRIHESKWVVVDKW